ncbi:uncharacterized protein LOC123219208 isoform X2 [Mangifera indica]|uniref:uncharacterized protein LOC123219208 isoform X2 n=1 Tax=Mangifera indica TaxID=29780 RepID=UPI001CFAFA83|nr:uncharacterized protein LOC123219208 isoform X2 [Mangifera indica]
MSKDMHGFVAWEEHIMCHERGNRVVHFYLKDTFGDLVLAVIGTERSIRHMMYVVSDEFLNAYGSERFINASTKWRARREVVDWLSSLVAKCQPQVDFSNSQVNGRRQDFGSHDLSMTGLITHQTHLLDSIALRKLRVQHSNIQWSGVAWICTKQLKHFHSFSRNGTTIAVHSFVFIMAEEKSHYLAYLEDMYEDKKGQKKVKVRWFHYHQEIEGVIPNLHPRPREVFITAHVQVISAESVDGLATVLTPMHYEKCVAAVPHTSTSSIHMCFRQIKNDKKVKYHKRNEEDEDPVRLTAKRSRSSKGKEGLEGVFGVKSTFPEGQILNGEGKYPKLKLRLSRKTTGIPQPKCPASFKVDEKIEFLCQDSGIRGCWFRCQVLQTSQKHLKVKYDDVEEADGPRNLEEWIPACRVAPPDKLGMRCPGRPTIRPWPVEDSAGCTFDVGAPVDAWWSNGWWEGVVIAINISGNDVLQVYLPGEDKFLTVQKKDVRTSKDWVGDKWVEVMVNPDILSFVSANTNSDVKHSMCSTIKEAQHCGSNALLEQKVITTSKLDVVKEVDAELAGSVMLDDLKNVKEVDIRKKPYVNVGNEISKVGDGNDEDVNDKANKQDVGDEAKMILDNDYSNESANQKKLVVESQQVIV